MSTSIFDFVEQATLPRHCTSDEFDIPAWQSLVFKREFSFFSASSSLEDAPPATLCLAEKRECLAIVPDSPFALVALPLVSHQILHPPQEHSLSFPSLEHPKQHRERSVV